MNESLIYVHSFPHSDPSSFYLLLFNSVAKRKLLENICPSFPQQPVHRSPNEVFGIRIFATFLNYFLHFLIIYHSQFKESKMMKLFTYLTLGVLIPLHAI